MPENYHALINSLKTSEWDGVFSRLYPAAQWEAQRRRYADLATMLYASAGIERISFFSAPGQVELGGNHTDHQGGCVLAAAIQPDTVAAVGRRTDGKVVIESKGFPCFALNTRNSLDPLSIIYRRPLPMECGSSIALVRGILVGFKERRFEIGGFHARISGEVPVGFGLSSSASFEMLICTILNELYNGGTVSESVLAEIAWKAECFYYGKPCGLMDQMTSALGGTVAIDFCDEKKPKIKKIAFSPEQFGYRMAIVSSGRSHADLTLDYDSVKREMSSVAAAFGKRRLTDVPEEQVLENVPVLREQCGDRAVLRSLNFYEESRRAVKERQALLRKSFRSFLRLVNESGSASFRYLQNVYPPGEEKMQGLSLALLLSERMLKDKGAYRVHGGGFAGSIQAFVPEDMAESYRAEMDRIFGAGSCSFPAIRECGACMLRRDENETTV